VGNFYQVSVDDAEAFDLFGTLIAPQ